MSDQRALTYKVESIENRIDYLATKDDILRLEMHSKTFATRDMLYETESKIEDFVPKWEMTRIDMELEELKKDIA